MTETGLTIHESDTFTIDEVESYCCDDMYVVSTLAKQLMVTIRQKAKLQEALKAMDSFLLKWKLNHIPSHDCLNMQNIMDEALASCEYPVVKDD